MLAKAYYCGFMRPTSTGRPRVTRRIVAFGCLAALALPVVAGAESVSLTRGAASPAPVCPLGASELSALVGKKVQRVDLSGRANPSGQCSFSAVGQPSTGKYVSPQVFLTVSPGGPADLRDLYLYYAKAHTKLAPPLQLASRPDLGQGAFRLTVADAPITTTVFLIGKSSIATLLVDLTGAASGKRDRATAEKILALLQDRL